MSSTAPAPWGSPPTPVMPRWYLQTLHSTDLPSPLQKIASPRARLRSLGDLATIWEHRNLPLTKRESKALIRMAYRIARPPQNQVVVPEGLGTDRLLQCPLRVRTLNCLRRDLGEYRPNPGQEVTAGQLLRLQNLGLVSLLDLMCVVEAGFESGYFQEPFLNRSYSEVPASSTTQPVSSAPAPPEPPDPMEIAWDSATVVLKRLLAAASEVNGARTLADALHGGLGDLAAELGMADHLDDIAIADLTGKPVLAHESLSALNELWEPLSSVERSILERRVLAASPLTLEELGHAANLTRERIRQIEKSVESRLNHSSITGPAVKCWIGMLAVLLRQELGPITTQHELEERVSATFPGRDESEEHDQALTEMARCLLRQESDYLCSDGLCLSPAARDLIGELKEQASSLADEIGLIDKTALQDCLPDETWHQHWAALLEQSGLHQLNGHLALRDTAKAKAKAALLAIGHPATKEEIGELSGLRPDRAGAQLSLLPGVVRADKHRWGLAEWVDDEYEGIPSEIIQRINEDGGSTRLNRLLEEIPRMFGVAESSVKAYLDTPAFHVEHGWVTEADEPTIILRRLEDVIDGHDENGDPYWAFEIEDRHLDGYSLHGVPNEVAAALDCEFGGRTTAMVRSPADCQAISIIWRQTSRHGPEIGRLGSALRNARIHGGEKAILIIHGESEVSFAPAPRSGQRPMDGNTHSALRSISPSFADSSRQFEGVQVGAPIAGRLTASNPVRADHTSSDSPDRKGNEV